MSHTLSQRNPADMSDYPRLITDYPALPTAKTAPLPVTVSVPKALASSAPRPSVDDARALLALFMSGDTYPRPVSMGEAVAAVQAAYAAGYVAGQASA